MTDTRRILLSAQGSVETRVGVSSGRIGALERVAFIRSGIRENSGVILSEVSRLQLRRDRYTFVQCALVS